MSTWVERDASTGEVLLCVQSGVGPAAPKRVLRLSREEALVLAGRLVVACDEDAEDVVRGAQTVTSVVTRTRKIAVEAKGTIREVGDFVDRLSKLTSALKKL